jgi:nitrogen PTS system EIIA component
MPLMSKLLHTEQVIDLCGISKDDVLRELCGAISLLPQVTDPDKLLAAIKKREAMMSTGIGMGIAIPHAKIESVTDLVIAVGRSQKGIDFQALDSKPVHLVILMAASNTQGDEFLKLLGRIGAFFISERHRDRFLNAGSAKDIYLLFQHMDEHAKDREQHAGES